MPRRRKHRRLRGRRRRRRQAAAFRARVTWVMGRVDRSEAGAWRWTWRMRQWSPEKAALSSMAQWRHERSPMSAPVEYSMLAQCHCSTCSADTSYAPSQPSGTRTKYLCLELGRETPFFLDKAHKHVTQRRVLFLLQLLVCDLHQERPQLSRQKIISPLYIGVTFRAFSKSLLNRLSTCSSSSLLIGRPSGP